MGITGVPPPHHLLVGSKVRYGDPGVWLGGGDRPHSLSKQQSVAAGVCGQPLWGVGLSSACGEHPMPVLCLEKPLAFPKSSSGKPASCSTAAAIRSSLIKWYRRQQSPPSPFYRLK